MKKTEKRFMIKDSGLIVDLVTGKNFTVNSTGMVIFRDFIEGLEPSEILEAVCYEFGVDSETARRDMDEFLLDLKVMGIDEL